MQFKIYFRIAEQEYLRQQAKDTIKQEQFKIYFAIAERIAEREYLKVVLKLILKKTEAVP